MFVFISYGPVILFRLLQLKSTCGHSSTINMFSNIQCFLYNIRETGLNVQMSLSVCT